MTEESGLAQKAEAFLKLGERLTLGVLVRIALAILVAAGGWYLIEHRDTAVPALLANQLMVTLAAACIALFFCGQGLAWVVRRFDAQTLDSRQLMQELIEEARRDLVDYKAEVKADMQRLQGSEARCQRALERMTRALKEAGITPPPNSQWGDLP